MRSGASLERPYCEEGSGGPGLGSGLGSGRDRRLLHVESFCVIVSAGPGRGPPSLPLLLAK